MTKPGSHHVPLSDYEPSIIGSAPGCVGDTVHFAPSVTSEGSIQQVINIGGPPGAKYQAQLQIICITQPDNGASSPQVIRIWSLGPAYPPITVVNPPSEAPHVIHVGEGSFIRVTSPAPETVIAPNCAAPAPLVYKPPHVIHIGALASQEGPQVIHVTSPPAPVVAAPVASEPPHVVRIGSSSPQEGPQVICVTSPIVAPALPVPVPPLPQVIHGTDTHVGPVPSAPANIGPASTQLTIVCLGPSEPVQPQVICITSTKPEPAPASSEPPHIICFGMGSRHEEPLQIVRITSATPKLPWIICLGSAALPKLQVIHVSSQPPHIIHVTSPGVTA
ncbi:hypothetical protein FRC11_013919 [Ceratobasidium sp. 423]|nr:hypothetical protein FRC11_013919 [Ceratobasidium sp. 423]